MTYEFALNYILIPLGIFVARILDVSLGTLRIMFMSREKKLISTTLAFFEVLIWLLVIQHVFNNMDNVMSIFGYTLGYASGNLVGLQIHKMLGIGSVLLRIITAKDASTLITVMKSKGYGLTSINAEGINGDVHVIFTIIPKKNLEECITVINKHNPKAYYTIEEVTKVSNSLYPGLSARIPVPYNLRKSR